MSIRTSRPEFDFLPRKARRVASVDFCLRGVDVREDMVHSTSILAAHGDAK